MPPPKAIASTTVPSGALSCSALPESTSHGMLLSATLPSSATMPPSASRLGGFSVSTTDAPASMVRSLTVDIQGSVERIRSMVQPAMLTGELPILVISSQSLSLSGTSAGMIRVNFSVYSPSHSTGSTGGFHSQTMLFWCLPVSSPTRTRPSSSTARLSGPARLFASHWSGELPLEYGPPTMAGSILLMPQPESTGIL